MKIGNQYFETYEEYQAAYIKKWEILHPILPVDLSWIKADWEYRMKIAA